MVNYAHSFYLPPLQLKITVHVGSLTLFFFVYFRVILWLKN